MSLPQLAGWGWKVIEMENNHSLGSWLRFTQACHFSMPEGLKICNMLWVCFIFDFIQIQNLHHHLQTLTSTTFSCFCIPSYFCGGGALFEVRIVSPAADEWVTMAIASPCATYLLPQMSCADHYLCFRFKCFVSLEMSSTSHPSDLNIKI